MCLVNKKNWKFLIEKNDEKFYEKKAHLDARRALAHTDKKKVLATKLAISPQFIFRRFFICSELETSCTVTYFTHRCKEMDWMVSGEIERKVGAKLR